VNINADISGSNAYQAERVHVGKNSVS